MLLIANIFPLVVITMIINVFIISRGCVVTKNPVILITGYRESAYHDL